MDQKELQARLLREWSLLRLELFSVLDAKLAEKEAVMQDLIDVVELNNNHAEAPVPPAPADTNGEHLDQGESEQSSKEEGRTASTEPKHVLNRSATTRKSIFDDRLMAHHLEKGSPIGDMLEHKPRARAVLSKVVDAIDWFRRFEEPPRTGWLAEKVDSAAFSTLITVVIIANCGVLLHTANWCMEHQSLELPSYIKLLDLSFMLVYVVELLLKLVVHRIYFFIGSEYIWNLFDLVLVVLAVQEQILLLTASGNSVTSLTFLRSLRTIRVSRVLRVFRVVRFISELRMMLYSIMSSIASLFWCLVLISLVLGMFSLLFLQIATDFLVSDGATMKPVDYRDLMTHYGSVGLTMATLYQSTTGGIDWFRPYELVAASGPFGAISFLFFIAFFNFAVFNVLTGIFVENAMKWSKTDHDSMLSEQRQKESTDAKGLKHLLQKHGRRDTTITWDDFEKLTQSESVLLYLASIGLEVHNTKTFFKLLVSTSGEEELDIDTFVTGCMRMKGPASSIDLMACSYEITLINKRQKRMDEFLQSLPPKAVPSKFGPPFDVLVKI